MNGSLFSFYFVLTAIGLLLSVAALKFSLSFLQVHGWFTDPSSNKHLSIYLEAPAFLRTLEHYEATFTQIFCLFSMIGIGLFFFIHLFIHYFRRREFRNYLLMGENIFSLSIQLVIEQLMLLTISASICFVLVVLFSRPLMDLLTEWEKTLIQPTTFFSELEVMQEMDSPKEVLEAGGPFTPRTIHSMYMYETVSPKLITVIQKRLWGQMLEGLFVFGSCSFLFHSLLLKWKSVRMHQA